MRWLVLLVMIIAPDIPHDVALTWGIACFLL